MADAPDRKNQTTLLNTLAARVIGRFQQTPMNSIVQRAIQPSRPEGNSPLDRATVTAGFIQRVTNKTQGVWKPRATTKQEAIEGFTDTLIQRFPDFSAKYVVRSAEDNSAESPMQMVYSGEPPQSGNAEEALSPTPSPNTATTSTFDVNSLPSIPAEIVARHKAEAQQRAASSGTKATGAKSPRAIQRQSIPNEPHLVRPRSKVDYIGSKSTSGAVSPITSTFTPTVPESTAADAHTSPLQAKVDESVIQETTPLEEPKWRTRPRAGFQSLPTKTSAQESSSAVPFTPIQADTPLQAKATDAPETLTDIPPTATSIERATESAPIHYTDEDDGDDVPPSGGSPAPDQPPPPPTSFPSASESIPVQRSVGSDSTVEMPLRVPPPSPPSTDTVTSDGDKGTDDVPSSSLSLGVPAKAIRRTSQAAPILRKPILPNSVPPLSATNASAPVSEIPSSDPSPAVTARNVGVPLQLKAKGDESVIEFNNDLTNQSIESLHEDNDNPSSPLNPLPINNDSSTLEDQTPASVSTTPMQRVINNADFSIEPFTTAPSITESMPPDRASMPLRVPSTSELPIQRQNESAESSVTPDLPPKDIEVSPITAPIPAFQTDAIPSTPTTTLHKTRADAPGKDSLSSTTAPKVSEPDLPSQPTFQPVQQTTVNITETKSTPVQRTGNADIAKPSITSDDSKPRSHDHEDQEVIRAIPNPPLSPVPERDAMPLRSEMTPIQRQGLQSDTEEDQSAEVSKHSVAEPTQINTPNLAITAPAAETPLQRVAKKRPSSDSHTKTTPAPSIQNRETVSSDTKTPPAVVDSAPQTATLPSSPITRSGNDSPSASIPIESSVSQNDETVQRVVAESTPTPLPTQSDIPLKVETNVTRNILPEANREHVSSNPTPKNSAKPLMELGVTEIKETPLSPTSATPLQRKSEESGIGSGNKNESIQEIAGESTRSRSEPLQRVTAPIAPTLPILPTQADMPVRHDTPKPSETIQRQADVEETNGTVPSITRGISASEIQPTLPVVVDSSTPTSQPETDTIQRQTQTEKGTTPTQRVEAGIAPPTLPIPSQMEMPLRQEPIASAPTTPTVQRRTEPNPISEAETVADSGSHTSEQATTNQPSATQTHAYDASDSPPIQRERSESATPETHTAGGSPFVAEGDSPIQRVSVEIESPLLHYPSTTEMPLRLESNTPDSVPIQRKNEIQGIQESEIERAEAHSPSLPSTTTPTIVQREILPDGSAHTESGTEKAVPLQRVAVEPTVPSQSKPTRADMPLHLESSNPDSAPIIRRTGDGQSGEAEKTITTAGDGSTDTTSSALPDVVLTSDTPITIQREPSIENNEPIAGNAEPIQRVIPESNQSSPATPSRDDMPLRQVETNSGLSGESEKSDTSIPTISDEPKSTTPIQKVESEATEPTINETPSIGNDILEVTPKISGSVAISAERGSPSPSTASTTEPPLQRVSVEASQPESSIPHREEMPLRASPPALQLKSDTEPERDDLAGLPAQATTPTTNHENLLPQRDDIQINSEPTLPAVAGFTTNLSPDETPAARSADTPSAPIHRKTTFKATRIQRRTTPIVQRKAMPVAPHQPPLQSYTNPIAQPALPAEPVETALEGSGFESVQGTSPVPAIVQRKATTPFATPSGADTPLRLFTATSRSQVQPITPAIVPIQHTPTPPPPSTSAPVEMPLVQRAQTNTTTDTESDEEYMDLRALLDDEAETSDGNSQTETVGGTGKKEPTESDAMRALETLAREIYPLLKQMIARERERHRGF